jgi:Cys-tRNA synthase (O-phospho-L-seryl-tRNA:Cys-tRNA synthase)
MMHAWEEEVDEDRYIMKTLEKLQRVTDNGINLMTKSTE